MERLADVTARLTEQHRSLEFCQFLSCLHLARGSIDNARELFLERWPTSHARDLVTKADGRYFTTNLDALSGKAVVGPGTTTDPQWAGALLSSDQLAAAFFDVAKRATLLGRIPGLRHIPLNVRVPALTQDANYVWVGQGQLKPISRFSFSDGVRLGPTKCLGIVVTSRELAELAVPGLAGVFRDLLINGLTGFTDRQFLDPAVAAVPDVHPASITNGVTPITGTGDLSADLGALLAALFAARPSAESAVLVVAPGTALTPKDLPFGVTVVTSPAAAGMIVALDPTGVFAADAGIAFEVSTQALLEMSDAPTGGPAAVLTSLWQENLAGFRVERFCNWEALDGAVQYLAPAAEARSSRRR